MPKVNILLRGMPASVGNAQGKVSVILDPIDLDKMITGNVLVTTMTNPLFVPAMKKAVAIVTDIGGQLCHAAIVAREFGIPCVAGTKLATKVLKDDMEVIVDGTNGLVTRPRS